jgi:AcrR family transcriptional regulator
VAGESLAAQLRQKRSEMMISEVAAIALQLFEERGFDTVTVDEIAATSQISVRTFYRYFPAKEDVLQVNIDRRAAALRTALAERPADEAPLHSLRVALADVVSTEDPVLRRRWTSVVAATPSVLPGVLGGSSELASTCRARAWSPPCSPQPSAASSKPPRRSGSSTAATSGPRSPRASRYSSTGSAPIPTPSRVTPRLELQVSIQCQTGAAGPAGVPQRT